jgi:hypothetical protein
MPSQPSLPPVVPTKARWFLVFGVVGLVAAFIMLYALSHDLVAGDLAIIFWPTSMVLISGGESLGIKTITTFLAFAGNFLVYGLVGLIIGSIAGFFQRAK